MAKTWMWIAVVLASAALLGGCSSEPDEQDQRQTPEKKQVKPTPPKITPLPGPVDPDAGGDLVRRMEGETPIEVPAVPGPWAQARVGQWVKFRGASGISLTRKVVKVDADTVTLAVSTPIAGKEITQETVVGKLVTTGQRAHAIPAGAKWSAATVRIGDRDVNCRVATWQKSVGGEVRGLRMYLSSEVPGEMVRSAEVDPQGKMKIVWELVDFGI